MKIPNLSLFNIPSYQFCVTVPFCFLAYYEINVKNRGLDMS